MRLGGVPDQGGPGAVEGPYRVGTWNPLGPQLVIESKIFKNRANAKDKGIGYKLNIYINKYIYTAQILGAPSAE